MKTIVANWKMNVGVRESVALARGTLLALRGKSHLPDVVVCPSFTSLGEVRKVITRSHISLGAQDVSSQDQGAMTGEISARMLMEAGVTHVIIGHSERRNLLHETNELIAQKIVQVFAYKMVPILCVGESSADRTAGRHQEVVQAQLRVALGGIDRKQTGRFFVAYEPVWAIGTGVNADVQDILEMHQFIRHEIVERLGDRTPAFRVLYGGSVTAENAYDYLREKEVDGLLVGGASVKLTQMTEILKAAQSVLERQSS